MPVERGTPHLSDAELARRCREGSTEAWSELVERFSRYVYAICGRGFGLAAHDAEDAFQEVFTRVYARLDPLAAASREQPVEDCSDERLERTIEEIDEAFAVREALEELGDPCRELL